MASNELSITVTQHRRECVAPPGHLILAGPYTIGHPILDGVVQVEHVAGAPCIFCDRAPTAPVVRTYLPTAADLRDCGGCGEPCHPFPMRTSAYCPTCAMRLLEGVRP